MMSLIVDIPNMITISIESGFSFHVRKRKPVQSCLNLHFIRRPPDGHSYGKKKGFRPHQSLQKNDFLFWHSLWFILSPARDIGEKKKKGRFWKRFSRSRVAFATRHSNGKHSPMGKIHRFLFWQCKGSVRGQSHSKMCLAVLVEFIDNKLQYSFTSTDGNMINAGRKNSLPHDLATLLQDLAKVHVIFSPMSLVRLCNFFGLGHVLNLRIIYSQPDLPLFCNQDADSKNAHFEVSETIEWCHDS